MNLPVSRGSANGTRGFTLVELLLVLVLMFLLLGAVVFNFSLGHREAQLNEGVAQFEALLHFAKAQAAFMGKRVEIRLAPSPMKDPTQAAVPGVAPVNLEVRWEPDPVSEPGVFQRLEEAGPYLGPISESLEVAEIRPTSGDVSNEVGKDSALMPSATNMTASSEAIEGRPAEFMSVMLFPDGSSDSVEFVLHPSDPGDGRTFVVTLDGVTGSIRHRIVVAEELAAAEAKPPSSGERTNAAKPVVR